jgi:hypothetical protein
MSAPITESHRELAQSIAEAQRGYTERPDEAAQLIADSEAEAVQSAMLREYGNLSATNEGLAKERDQLRADCENETKWAAHYLADAQNARARAERAEAVSEGRLKALNEKAEEARSGWQRAERAEAEVAALKQSVESGQRVLREDVERNAARAERAEEIAGRYGKRAISLEAELAAERARLDWLRDNVEEIYSKDQHGIVYLSGDNIRSAIDAAMKEGA